MVSFVVLALNARAMNVETCSVDLVLPKSVMVNNDDDNGLNTWDKDDIPFRYPNDEGAADDELKQGSISIGVEPDASGQVTVVLESGDEKVGYKAWKDPYKREVHPLTWQVTNGQLASEPPPTFYIEDVEHSETKEDVKMHADLIVTSPEECEAEDDAVTTVYEIDLDVDSENKQVRWEPPIDSDSIDKRENSFRPGKLVPRNSTDVDADGIPDYADGYNLFTKIGVHAEGEEYQDDDVLGHTQSFTMGSIEIKEPLDPWETEICFYYSMSDPTTPFSPPPVRPPALSTAFTPKANY
jgi:hypothetical protein